MSQKTIPEQIQILFIDGTNDVSTRLEREASDDVAVTVATTAHEGLDLLLSTSADCIVSTLELPDMDGLGFLQIVRAKYPQLPFILFPSDGGEELASKAIRLGVTDYLPNHSEESVARLFDRIDDAVTVHRERGTGNKRGDLLSRAFEAIDDSFYLLNEDGQFIFWNDTVSEATGYTDEEIASMYPTDFFEGEDANLIARAIEQTLDDGQSRVEANVVTKDGRTVPTEFTGVRVIDEDGDLLGICGVGRNIRERKRRERALREREGMLTALHNATGPLMHAETKREIAHLAVETADDVLDLSGVAVYLFDKPMDRLRVTAHSSDMADLLDDTSIRSDGDVVWESYVSGETSEYADIRTHESVNESTIRSAMMIPLGDHGVFFAGDTTVDAFDESNVDFVELLAANTEAALDRAEREGLLRDRDAELDQRNEQLEELNRINTVIRDIDRALVGASSKSEIKQEVCDKLVDTDPYRFAWIYERDDAGGVRPCSWAGTEDGYVDTVLDKERDETLTEAAGGTDDLHIVDDMFQNRQTERWRQEALKRGYRSAISVPLSYQEANYGVLEVYADRIEAFDEETQTVLAELGETIGHAINSISRKDALMTEHVIQLEFDVHNESDFWARSARRMDTTLEIRAFTPQGEGSYQSFVTIEGEASDQFQNIATESTIISDVSLISDHEGESLYECHMTGATTVTTLADYGAIPRKVVADSNGERVVAEVPQATDIGVFVQTFTDHYPDAELVARREDAQSGQIEGAFRETVTDRLTDRQQEVLQIAFLRGFYDWPRNATGEEIADSLDIVSSTLHQHLRAGQRKLLEALFE